MKTYYVWFTLCDKVEAEDEAEAFEIALARLREEGGADIVKHQVLDQ